MLEPLVCLFFACYAEIRAEGLPVQLPSSSSGQLILVVEQGLDVELCGDERARTSAPGASRLGLELGYVPGGVDSRVQICSATTGQALGSAIVVIRPIKTGSRQVTDVNDPSLDHSFLANWVRDQQTLDRLIVDGEALEALLRLPKEPTTEAALIQRARALAVSSRFAEAASDLESLAQSSRMDATALIGRNLWGHVRTMADMGDLTRDGCDEGYPGYQAVRDVYNIASEAGDQPLIGSTANNLAAWSFICGDKANVAQWLAVARDALKASGQTAELVAVMGNLAMVLFEEFGRYPEAQQELHSALTILENHPNRQMEALILGHLGNMYRKLGDTGRAQSYFSRALNSYESASSAWGIASTHRKLAAVSRELGRLDDSVIHYRQAIDGYRALGMSENLSRAQTQLAQLLVAIGDREGAQSEADQVSRVLLAAPDAVPADIVANYHLALAQLSLLNDEREAGLQHLMRANEVASAIETAPEYIAVATEIVELFTIMGQEELATSTINQAMESVLNQSSDLDPLRIGPAWSRRISQVVGQKLNSLINQYRVENDRAILLQAAAHLDRAAYSNLHKRRVAPESPAGASLARAVSEEASSLAADSTPEVESALNLSLQQEQFIRSQDIADNGISPERLREIVRSVSADTALIYFSLEARESHAILLHRSTMELVPMNVPDVDSATAIPELPFLMGPAREMIVPLLESIPDGVTRLLIMNVGPNMSLAAISIDGHSYRPLITELDIVFMAGARAFDEESTGTSTHQVTMIAAPEFGGDIDAAGDRTATGWTRNLDDLPFARDEALSIYHIVPDSSLHIGIQATTSALLSRASREAAILHVATHGYGHPDMDISGLAFTDGFLTEYDLGKRFHNDLVYLNACSTNVGIRRPGEGSLSLARAFLSRGARSAISTRWPVEDRSSSLMAKYFYEQAMTGMTSANALRAAQLRLMANHRFRDPRHWAAYEMLVADASYLDQPAVDQDPVVMQPGK